MLCFAAQNRPRKTGLPRSGSFSDRPRFIFTIFEESLERKLRFHIFTIFSFWRTSRTEAPFSHLQLSLLEGSPRKLRFHIFNFEILRKVSHESFAFTSSTFSSWGKSTKASFLHLQVSLLEGSPRKLRFHIFNFMRVLHEGFVFASSTFRCWGTSRTKASFSQVEVQVRQGCGNELLMFFRILGAFHVPL